MGHSTMQGLKPTDFLQVFQASGVSDGCNNLWKELSPLDLVGATTPLNYYIN